MACAFWSPLGDALLISNCIRFGTGWGMAGPPFGVVANGCCAGGVAGVAGCCLRVLDLADEPPLLDVTPPAAVAVFACRLLPLVAFGGG